jgi:hypothetical protein
MPFYEAGRENLLPAGLSVQMRISDHPSAQAATKAHALPDSHYLLTMLANLPKRKNNMGMKPMLQHRRGGYYV